MTDGLDERDREMLESAGRALGLGCCGPMLVCGAGLVALVAVLCLIVVGILRLTGGAR